MHPGGTPPGDAIVAIGTPPGIGGRAMLRLSGRDLLGAVASIFDPPLPDGGPSCLGTSLAIGSESAGRRVPCIALVSRAPRSFTGEDVVEILLPANRALLDRATETLRERIVAIGGTLRAAGPGEFTARAFLAGRLDAADVTGVALAIAADEERGLDAANRWRSRGEADEVAEASAALAGAIARLEAGIDFTDEEDVVGCSAAELRSSLEAIRAPLRRIRETTDAVAAADSDRFRVVLAGPPNAGKSSLFNRLVDAERTVAHDRPGTTRDAIEVDIDLDDGFGTLGVTIVDTAGLGPTSDPLAATASQATDRARRSADLEIWCVPADARSDDRDGRDAESELEGIPRVAVLTKSDMASDRASELVSSATAPRCSAVTGAGVEGIRRLIATHAERRVGLGATTAALLEEIRRDLDLGLDRLEEAMAMLDGVPDGAAPVHPEIVASIVHGALDTIGRRFGGHDPETVLDLIFGSFCIGK